MPTTAALLLTGAIAGLSIAMPIGPFNLLLIQRSLRGGFLPGFSTGLGGATATVGGAVILLFGLHHLLPAVPGGDRVLGVLGGLMLLWSAARTVGARRLQAKPAGEPSVGCAPAYVSAVVFNAANPLALVLLLAALSPVLGGGAPPALNAVVLVLGMATASCAWYGCLSLIVSLLRARLGVRLLKATNRVAGGVLAVYAVVALASAVRF